MPKNLLTKTKKNLLHNLIRRLGLNASEFEWQEAFSVATRSGLVVSKLVHRPTKYYYLFDFFTNRHWTERSPTPDRSVGTEFPESWDNQLSYAYEWLECVKREIEAPDLWAIVSQERALIEATATTQEKNMPFNTQEIRHISEQLNEIKEFLFTTQNLSDSHRQFVTMRLNYLAEAAKRQGRVDWNNIAVGVLVNIVVQTALPSEAARELLRLAWNALSQLLGGTPALP